MTEQPEQRPDGDVPPGERAPTDHPESEYQEVFDEVAGRVGNALGRFARVAKHAAEVAAHEAERAAEAARPEAERLARRAKAAAEAARPHMERAAQEARKFVSEHDEEIKRAAKAGATEAARMAVPGTLRPVIGAMTAEQRRALQEKQARAAQGPTPVEAVQQTSTPGSEAQAETAAEDETAR